MADSAVDSSIALNAGKPTNPMGQTMPNLLANPQALNALMQMGGKLAAGRALQASIGPEGNIDFGKFNSLVSQDPAAAATALESINSGLDASAKQIDQQLKKRQASISALTGLLNTTNDKTAPDTAQKEAYGVMTNLHKQGVVDARDVVSMLGMIPRDQSNNINVPAFRQQVMRGVIELLPAAEKARAITGQIFQTDTGSGIQYNRFNPYTGQWDNVTGVLPYGLSARDLSQMIKITRPDGSTYDAPLGSIVKPDQLERHGYGAGTQGTIVKPPSPQSPSSPVPKPQQQSNFNPSAEYDRLMAMPPEQRQQEVMKYSAVQKQKLKAELEKRAAKSQ